MLPPLVARHATAVAAAVCCHRLGPRLSSATPPCHAAAELPAEGHNRKVPPPAASAVMRLLPSLGGHCMPMPHTDMPLSCLHVTEGDRQSASQYCHRHATGGKESEGRMEEESRRGNFPRLQRNSRVIEMLEM